MEDSIANLISTYHELNAAVVDELDEEPTPLEFMRYVAKNRPFVVRRAAEYWKAVQSWDAGYLNRMMGDEAVKVVVTPHGNADAVVKQEDGLLAFIEPHETFEPFGRFLADIQKRSKMGEREYRNVKYAQTQNDNLRNEYESLYADVPKNIPFARIALDEGADAINLWLGDDRSVTALHKDNYENIYVQVRGQKHFVLLPPVEMPCVNEQPLPKGRYVPSEHTDTLGIQLDTEAEPVPVAVWDPDTPDKLTTPYSHLAKPLRVTLREGDMLYLPSLWYHKVSQSVGEEGFVCAVNYWYDMDFSGHFWASNNFVRDVVNGEKMKPAYPELETDGQT
ncbi:hypothetical protein LTR36_002015 [Oleoguttula mirabilis]|uniref:JmjC domain-containing protein n=1 Tax=Oleoguttula mirabilis TaxID=1507867 RepID=A0AAV9JM34_9PEZI|nr:hypothetical protein LTR36_002015 [Oleoguttula mirabilis]